MSSLLTIFLVSTLSFGLTSVDLAIVNVPIDSAFDLPLSPAGQVEVRLKETVTRLKVKIERIQPLTAFNRFHRAYIVWASSPEGEFENLGELEIKGQKAELETVTRLQRFGILITAEPHFMVDLPSSNVAFRSRTPRNEEIRVEEISLKVGTFDYSHISLAPFGTIPPRVLQARMAFQIAVEEETERLVNSAFRQARVAIESMDQLLRRGMPLDVLLPYANEAIRASHRSTVLARKQPAIDKLQTVTAQADALLLKEKELISDLQRLRKLKSSAEERLAATRSLLTKSTEEKRELDILNEGIARKALTAEAEVIRLQNHWPRLERALLDHGARQTARGLLLTLSGEHFDPSRASLKQETREILARFAGVLTFNLIPLIRIEGHTDASGREDKNIELSEERAVSVQSLLVELGFPEDNIYSEGFGSSRPLVPNDDAESRSINRRVEILFREP